MTIYYACAVLILFSLLVYGLIRTKLSARAYLLQFALFILIGLGVAWVGATIGGWVANRSGPETADPIAFERFTDEARHAVLAARDEAHRDDSQMIEPRHVLIGFSAG